MKKSKAKKKREKKRYLRSLNDQIEKTQEREFYSIKRIDLLIISISSFGILLITQLDSEKGLTIQNLSAVSFACAVIINFLSQWFGYYANRNETKWAQEEIKVFESGDTATDDLKKFDSKSKKYNRNTNRANIISTIALFLGIALLTISILL